MNEIHKQQNIQTASPQDRDTELGRALARKLSSSKGACPAPENIALLVDGDMDEADRDILLGHLASCDKCRDIFLAARKLTREKSAGSSRRGWYVISSFATAAVVAFCMIKILPLVRPSLVADTTDSKTIASRHVGKEPEAQPRVDYKTSHEAPKSSSVKSMVASRRVTPLELLSAEEAALPMAKTFGFVAPERSDGPLIVVENPSQDDTKFAGTSLRIKFVPRLGEKVDLTTLRLEYLKENPVDLTQRIKPYVTPQGISVDKVRVPEGFHRFRVRIADYHGKLSEKEFVVSVTGAF